MRRLDQWEKEAQAIVAASVVRGPIVYDVTFPSIPSRKGSLSTVLESLMTDLAAEISLMVRTPGPIRLSHMYRQSSYLDTSLQSTAIRDELDLPSNFTVKPRPTIAETRNGIEDFVETASNESDGKTTCNAST